MSTAQQVSPMWDVGVDVGGTFTDIVAVQRETGETRDGKVLSTPRQEDGVLAAIASVELSVADLAQLVHGHTVGINAILSRSGSKTGLLATSGHRDLLDIGRMNREFGDRFYDPSWIRPHQERPIIERSRRIGVTERMYADGSVAVELDEKAVHTAALALAADGVESIGVCFLNSYVNPAHEQRAIEILREVLPDVYVQSSALYPVTKEHERTTTVALDAYVGPVVTSYLDRLAKRLGEHHFVGSLWIMMMNGGVATIADARQAPVFQLVSGPVGGVAGAIGLAKSAGLANLITMDVGGTSTDVSAVAGVATPLTDLWTIEQGLTLTMPLVDVGSVGSGAGSILAFDRLGSLRVGPASAGSNPGPASYGRGGLDPTLTDACAQLGILQPDLFAGGSFQLNVAMATDALARVGEPVEMSADELAAAAYEVACSDVANKIRAISVYRGLDVREFSLMAFGAAGPMLANRVAQIMRLGRVVVPPNPGQFSALGLLSSDLRVTRAESPMTSLTAARAADLEAGFAKLETNIKDDLAAQGVDITTLLFERAWFGMYTGQTWDNRLPLVSAPVRDDVITGMQDQFHRFYLESYGFSAEEIPVFLTTIEVTGVSNRSGLPVASPPEGNGESLIRCVSVALPGSTRREVPVHHRDRLVKDGSVPGPALIVEKFATTVVLDGYSARRDGDLLIIDTNEKGTS